MELNIQIIETNEFDKSSVLEELATQIEIESATNVTRQYKKPERGKKDVSLEAITLLFAGITTVATIINILISITPNVTIETEIDGVKITIEHPDQVDVNALLSNELEHAHSETIRMIIKHKKIK